MGHPRGGGDGAVLRAGTGGAWAATEPVAYGFGDGIERGGFLAMLLFAVDLDLFDFLIGSSTGGASVTATVMPPAAGFLGRLDRVGLLAGLLFMVEPVPSGLRFLAGAGPLRILGRTGGKRAQAAQQERARKQQEKSFHEGVSVHTFLAWWPDGRLLYEWPLQRDRNGGRGEESSQLSVYSSQFKRREERGERHNAEGTEFAEGAEKRNTGEETAAAFERKSPPFANGAKDGAPSRSVAAPRPNANPGAGKMPALPRRERG